MKVVLPVSGHSVELEDYITQEAVEAVEEIILGGVNMSDESWRRVTTEDVMKVFPDMYDRVMKEQDEDKREAQMNSLKKKVIATDPKRGGVSGADYARSQRVEVVYTIRSVETKDGKKIPVPEYGPREDLTQWIIKLPAPDYRFLKNKVAEIGRNMESNLEQGRAD